MNTRWPQTIGTSLLAVFLIAGSPLASAEKGYYKWLDERGNPQHSDRPPPPGIEYEFVSTDTGLRRRVTADDNQTGSSAPALPVAARSTPTAAEDQVTVEKDPAVCDRARANLDTLNSGARVRIRDGDDIRYLTNEEREIQKQKAQDLISVHCSS